MPIAKRKETKEKGGKEVKRSRHRLPMTLNRHAYPSDLTNEQRELLEPLAPGISPQAAYHVHERMDDADSQSPPESVFGFCALHILYA